METFYAIVFGVLAVLMLGLFCVPTQNSDGSIFPSGTPNVASFIRLRISRVSVHVLMTGELLQATNGRVSCDNVP